MLLRVSGEINVVHAERIVRSHDDADRAVNRGDLLDRHHVVDIAELRAAQFRRNQHAEQSHLPKLLYHGRGKLARLVPFHDVRGDLLRGKGAYLAAKLLLLLSQAEGVAGRIEEGWLNSSIRLRENL